MGHLSALVPIGGKLLDMGASAIGANGAKKAAKAQADAVERAAKYQSDQLRELAKPYMEQMSYAMPAFRNLIASSYSPQVGKDNPLLAAEHQTNSKNIQRQENAALANASRYWGLMGNLSRGRGEALRIGQNATEAANAENLGYGRAQMDYRNQATDRFANALSALNSMASPGLGLLTDAGEVQAKGVTSASGIRATADQDYWRKMAGTISAMLRK